MYSNPFAIRNREKISSNWFF